MGQQLTRITDESSNMPGWRNGIRGGLKIAPNAAHQVAPFLGSLANPSTSDGRVSASERSERSAKSSHRVQIGHSPSGAFAGTVSK
jgi:hypothetical protein